MNDTTKQPESIPAVNVANTMSEEEYAAIKLHAYHLQGFVEKGDIIELSTMTAEALEGFNVYIQYQEMAIASIKDETFVPKPAGLEDWLIEKNLIRVLDASAKVATSWVFKTYPFSPSYTDILKTGLILTTSVGDKDLHKFTTDDLKVYALMRATVSQHSPDPEKTPAENIQNLIVKLRELLVANEQAYLKSAVWRDLTELTEKGLFVNPDNMLALEARMKEDPTINDVGGAVEVVASKENITDIIPGDLVKEIETRPDED